MAPLQHHQSINQMMGNDKGQFNPSLMIYNKWLKSEVNEGEGGRMGGLSSADESVKMTTSSSARLFPPMKKRLWGRGGRGRRVGVVGRIPGVEGTCPPVTTLTDWPYNVTWRDRVLVDDWLLEASSFISHFWALSPRNGWDWLGLAGIGWKKEEGEEESDAIGGYWHELTVDGVADSPLMALMRGAVEDDQSTRGAGCGWPGARAATAGPHRRHNRRR